jgi:hypothetical protein
MLSVTLFNVMLSIIIRKEFENRIFIPKMAPPIASISLAVSQLKTIESVLLKTGYLTTEIMRNF